MCHWLHHMPCCWLHHQPCCWAPPCCFCSSASPSAVLLPHVISSTVSASPNAPAPMQVHACSMPRSMHAPDQAAYASARPSHACPQCILLHEYMHQTKPLPQQPTASIPPIARAACLLRGLPGCLAAWLPALQPAWLPARLPARLPASGHTLWPG